jgi:hypothetical protein
MLQERSRRTGCEPVWARRFDAVSCVSLLQSWF